MAQTLTAVGARRCSRLWETGTARNIKASVCYSVVSTTTQWPLASGCQAACISSHQQIKMIVLSYIRKKLYATKVIIDLN